jgi:hypothetical protein
VQYFISETMNDLGRGYNEMTLSKLNARREEITREMSDDIQEIREDLIQLVSEFTCVISEKTESIQNLIFSRISDVEQQICRLNESNMTMSTFTDIFHQFNSLTSKILEIDSSMLLGSNPGELESSIEKEPTTDRKTTVTPSQINSAGSAELSPQTQDKKSIDIQSKIASDHSSMITLDGVDASSKTTKKRNLSEIDISKGAKSSSKSGGLRTGVL